MIILIPILVCLVGALVYALSANPKLAELGRLAYFAGLFWTVASFSKSMIHLLGS